MTKYVNNYIYSNALRTTASLSNDAFLESKAVVKFQNGFMFIVELT